MIRDPFYQDVVKKLNGKLDPELFEQCAADLLKNIYPSLVPIRGGQDAGMDGAISDGEGNAFPLVTTTDNDVIGNLTKSLKSYLNNNGLRRKIVLATSKQLTPKRRQNLEKRASELGFILIQIHAQEAFADLLYRSPEWCRELLNLTGEPSSLSIIPLSSRPQVVDTLIGRLTDLDWLVKTDGDLLVIGQPGSGKTCLMSSFAKQNEGLFLVNDNEKQIAQSIRSEIPKTIIVDDAHVFPDRLNLIRNIRTQLGEKFRILATAWPGYRDNILHQMQIPSSSSHELELLTRDQIVELIKQTGIIGPTDLIRELVNQAEGKPGLAATLCYLCLKGDVKQIITGDTLLVDVKATFEPILGKNITAIIAAFALGGDKGMSMDVVAKENNLQLINLQHICTGLAFGGVLLDVGQGRLSVRPPSLRFALVKEIYFHGATSIPCVTLISQSPDIVDTAITLIGAKTRGANIPEPFLTDIVNQANSSKVWEHFAYLGPNECNWLLDNHPNSLVLFSDVALNYIPQRVIPMLLDLAINDNRPTHSNPDHPIRKIEDWIKSAEPGIGQAVKRREVLLNSILDWVAISKNEDAALRALKFVLSPVFSDGETAPGSQLVYSYRTGILNQEEMLSLTEFWPRIRTFLQESVAQEWEPIFEVLHKWLYPGNVAERVSNEIRKMMRDMAIRIANDIAEMNTKHPGIVSRISRILKQFNIPLKTEISSEFDVLYPIENSRREFQKMYTGQADAAKDLAEKWCSQDPKTIVSRLNLYEAEAHIAGLNWPRWSAFVAETIADKIHNPIIWAQELIKGQAENDLIIPFLKAASDESVEYRALLCTCLDNPRLLFAAISAGLTASMVPKDVFPKIISAIEVRYASWIELECYRKNIPEDRVVALLTQANLSIAAAVAIGVWQANPGGTIAELYKNSWRTAIIRGMEHQFEGQEIFKKDPSLAYEWLELRTKDKRGIIECDVRLRDVALEVISHNQRINLLQNLEDDIWYGEVIQGIVSNDLEVYRVLLAIPRLKRYHLSPLAGTPDEQWTLKALEALDAGYSSKDIAFATMFEGMRSWSGTESNHWEQWVISFQPLITHYDPRVREIGKSGQDFASSQREKALIKERREDIYGM